MVDIHNYRRRLERTLENIRESSEISKENKKIIMKFHDNCFAEGISICKTERYLYDLYRMAKTIDKSIANLTKDDLKEIVLKG